MSSKRFSNLSGFLLVFSQSSSQGNATFSDTGGYYKFPNGLIMQWGTVQYRGGYDQHSYPIPFPHKAVSITGALSNGGSNGANWSVGLVNNEKYYVFTDESNQLSWIAIGY